VKRWELLRLYFCAAGSFAIFSSIFNYLPFRLDVPPFRFSTELTTLVYLVYVIGIFMGPTAGRISNRFGSGNVLFCYAGGWLGITGSGFAYRLGGWSAAVLSAIFLLIIPLCAGIGELKISNRQTRH
jgi:MFS transporter, YNFM family, putative membrane transport protein